MLNLSVEFNIDMEMVSPCRQHFCGANDIEVELNRALSNRFEEIFRICPLDAFLTLFVMSREFSFA
jgi:hypothetical protein